MNYIVNYISDPFLMTEMIVLKAAELQIHPNISEVVEHKSPHSNADISASCFNSLDHYPNVQTKHQTILMCAQGMLS